jgi:hypothetical protein
MSDLEMWSVPWHTLQRRLAKGVGAELGVKPLHAPAALGANTGSWLIRALTAVPPQHDSPGRLE